MNIKSLKKIYTYTSELVNERKILSKVASKDRALIKNIRSKKLTYLSRGKLTKLALTIQQLENESIEGEFIECGCALGGSTILICSVKSKNRPLKVYDVFEMIPAPTDQDTKDVHKRYEEIISGKSKGIKGDQYYGYINDLKSKVEQNLNDFGINLEDDNTKLIKGLVQETLYPSKRIALAHIDVDWYEPVKVSLDRIFPYLSKGGTIILDDYFDWGGCKKAVDLFLSEIKHPVSINKDFRSLSIKKL